MSSQTPTFSSVAAMFLHRVEQTPDAEAFAYRAGQEWPTLTWRQVGDRVRRIAGGLRALGLALEDRVGIQSTTRVEWVLADLAIMCAGGATTTVYPSNTPDECAYILRDSEARFVFAEDDKQVAKLTARRAEMPKLEKVIVFDGSASADGWVLTLAELERRGEERDPAEHAATVAAVRPEHLATLIYTSGTTGVPKGVELTHDAWLFEGEAIDALGILGPNDRQYLWLPLSHSFGKVLEVAQLRIGFPTSIDGDVNHLVDNLAIVRPTFVAAAPRIFEKVYNKVVSGVRAGSAVRRKIFDWAFSVGRRCSELRQKRQEPGGLLALKERVARKLVFSKLQERFGGRLRFFVSGSAPLSPDMARFFHAAGILILEGYGLTESSAATFVNVPQSFAFGTVGPPLPGVEVQIAKDGEILLKGRGIMRGYHNKPEETGQVLLDGWLQTGDIGELDEAGRLRITDRKKDLIKTSGGKYIAPNALESRLKSLSPYLSQVLVHGDRRNFVTALVTLDQDSLAAWKDSHGLNGTPPAELAENPELRAMVQDAVDALNREVAKYATIKKFAILPGDLSVEAGELTPSLKVKRKVVEARYKQILDGFYSGSLEN